MTVSITPLAAADGQLPPNAADNYHAPEASQLSMFELLSFPHFFLHSLAVHAHCFKTDFPWPPVLQPLPSCHCDFHIDVNEPGPSTKWVLFSADSV